MANKITSADWKAIAARVESGETLESAARARQTEIDASSALQTEADKLLVSVQKFADSALKRFSPESIALFIPAFDPTSKTVANIELNDRTDSALKNAVRPQFVDFQTVGIVSVRAVGKTNEHTLRLAGTGSALMVDICGSKDAARKAVASDSSARWLVGDASDADAPNRWEFRKTGTKWTRGSKIVGAIRDAAAARAVAS